MCAIALNLRIRTHEIDCDFVSQMTSEFPDEVDQRRWDEAYRRADAIGDFLRQRTAGSTAEDIAGLAAKLGLSQATTYR